MTTQNQENGERDELSLVSTLGGFQLYTAVHPEQLKNVEILRANDKVKIIVEPRFLYHGLENMRERIITTLNHAGVGRPSLDEVIRTMEDFRKRNGPLCPRLESDAMKLKEVYYPCGDDRNYATVTRIGSEYGLIPGKLAGESVASIPDDLMKKRRDELEQGREMQAVSFYCGRERFWQDAKRGKLNPAQLVNIASAVNDNTIMPECGERLLTPELVRSYVSHKLDYLSFEIARLKSQAAIAHYLESRRDK